MRDDILNRIDDPQHLEKLYRDNKTVFKKEFNSLYPQIAHSELAKYWNARLNYESAEISWGSKNELIFVIVASLLAGVIAKVPALFNIDPEFFYMRNTGLIVFPILTAYFIWKKGLSTKKIIFSGVAFLISLIFINLLPKDIKSDTLILSCIHLPIFLWSILGVSYIGDSSKDYHKRIQFLRYNGELLIMSGLILIAGGILTGITIGLFEVIGFKIEKFYFDYIVVFGLPAVPLVATYLTQTNPQLVNKVSPVIAKIFSPVVLVMLLVYLSAIFISDKDPYTDRNFLILFNMLLIGVMAIILFSVAETFKKNDNRSGIFILFALSLVTIIVNGIALSAILFRISEWGITPNRLAVLGANVLILSNLFLVTFQLFKSVSKKAGIKGVENSISLFLPIYVIWTIIVAFIFPLIFGFV